MPRTSATEAVNEASPSIRSAVLRTAMLTPVGEMPKTEAISASVVQHNVRER